jgi:hypothetical protein
MHSRHLNEQMVRVLKAIGYDIGFCRGEGQYLYDRDGARYLDLLSGFGVFAVGRNHPALRQALKSVLDAELPNLVQMDVSPVLPGLVSPASVLSVKTGDDHGTAQPRSNHRITVYAVLVDRVVRYVGKGRNGRMYSHLIEAKRPAARCAPDTSGLYPRMRYCWIAGDREHHRLWPDGQSCLPAREPDRRRIPQASS